MRHSVALLALAACVCAAASVFTQQSAKVTVLHAAHLLDVAGGRLVSPGEVLVEGNRIREVGEHVAHPAGAQTIDLGSATLMPGLIDAHTHLFLHVGDEAFQTVRESVPERTLIAADAAKSDVLAGFTAERDMGTEGAGCADVAIRNAINKGLILGPRMRVSCNAIDINGGHEDNGGMNPEEHLLSNADRANGVVELINVMREQKKQGSDFAKIYETGRDHYANGVFTTPYQYSEAELAAAVTEAHRTGSVVGVHCTGEPGASYAAEAGVIAIDHADTLSAATMKMMREKGIFAIPTFQIAEYFADHAASPAGAASRRASNEFHASEFKKQLAAGVPFAVGSDVGPFPHGTQAHEYELMVKFGMKPADVLRAGLINGAKVLQWADSIGQLKAEYFADVIAVPGDPLTDITVLQHVSFVMKNGDVLRKD